MRKPSRLAKPSLLAGVLGAFCTFGAHAQSGKVVIATGADPNFGVFYVASLNGAFERHGLDVEVATGASGSAQVPLLISGDVQLAFGSGIACIRAHMVDPTKVAYFAEGSILNEYDGVVAHDDITSLEDLKGKRVGLAMGTGSEVFFTTLIGRQGMSLSDFEIVPVDAPEMLPAIQRRDIDAYAAWEPWVSRGVAAIPGTSVLLTSKGVWSPSSVICGDKQWAEQNPEDAASLMAALAETADWMNDNPEEASKLVSEFIKLDLALTESLVRKVVFRTHIMESSIAAIMDDYNNLVARDLAPQEHTPDWWKGFIFDAPLRAGAPDNVSYTVPGE